MTTDSENQTKPKFGEAFARLEKIAELLETPELELEEAEKLVDEAKALEEVCREKLADQKLKITELFEKTRGASDEG